MPTSWVVTINTSPSWHQGFLGADLEFDRRSGTWRVGRIPNGDGWDPDLVSPLSGPSVDIVEGDRIVAVDGRAVGRSLSPAQALTDRAGRAIELTVKRGRRKERRVAVKTLRSEGALRYRDWVEANRRAVHEATDGEAGYLHIPDMGARGYSEFHRYFPVEVTRQGLVVDVRFNGGGNVSQLLIQKLLRRRVGYGPGEVFGFICSVSGGFAGRADGGDHERVRGQRWRPFSATPSRCMDSAR